MLGFSHPEDFCPNLFLQSYIYILLFTTRVGCFTVNWIFFAFNWFFVKIVPWLDTTLTGKIILSFPRSVSWWSKKWNSAQWKSSYNHNQTAFKNQKRELWVISHQLLCDPYHRYVCQDIGGSDPERMAAPRVEEYIRELFEGSPVKVSYLDY